MSLNDNPSHANRVFFQNSLARQRAEESALSGQFIRQPNDNAEIVNWQSSRDSLDRIEAEQRAMDQWTYEPLPHTLSARLREQFAAESAQPVAPTAAPARHHVAHLPSPGKVAADLRQSLDAMQLTSEGVSQSILKECGMDVLPPPAAAASYIAETAAECSEEHLVRYALHGEGYLNHMRKTQPAAAMAIECAVLSYEQAGSPPASKLHGAFAMYAASLRPSAMDLCERAHHIHDRAKHAVRAGLVGEPVSFEEILSDLVRDNLQVSQ